jgi:ABC-type sulfate transport system permease component
MALATLFVTMPFVVRELLPILEQMDLAEEEAARWAPSPPPPHTHTRSTIVLAACAQPLCGPQSPAGRRRLPVLG